MATLVEIDELQQSSIRKIQLTHLVYALVEEGILPDLKGKACLNIGPSSSGIDGFVLRQFGVTHIDAIEQHPPFVEQLLLSLECIAAHDKRYEPPFYRRVVTDTVNNAHHYFPLNTYDLIVGFNFHPTSMDWAALPKILSELLREHGIVFLTTTQQDAPSIRLGHYFSELRMDFTSYLSERPISTHQTTPGFTQDQFSFSLPADFSYKTTYDEFVFIATKLPKV